MKKKSQSRRNKIRRFKYWRDVTLKRLFLSSLKHTYAHYPSFSDFMQTIQPNE